MTHHGSATLVLIALILALMAALAMLGSLEDSRNAIASGQKTINYAPDTPLPGPQYYSGIDFDTLTSNDHLTIIPLKSFRQQATNFTCGPVASMTLLSYYNMPVPNTDAEEQKIAREMNTSETIGTNPEQIAAWFTRNGWNATWGTNGTRGMLIDNLNAGIPPMVEWIDWGGHWVVVIGYDTRGTDNVWDDVIIFADSADCHDDRVDGITYMNYGQFDQMWFDAHYFPENMRNRAYVVAVPA
ncbi:MAG TPA: C39 family peptidase [Methanoregula sp.]|nr:C39 family peptidase [Methanoregula sp.]